MAVASVGAKLLEAGGIPAGSYLLLIYAELLNLQLWRPFTYAFVETSGFGLLLNLFIFYLFGASFELRWGLRDFLRFCAFSAVGAAILALPLHFLFDEILPFRDFPIIGGPTGVIDAMLVALAVSQPNSNILLGFVLPIKVRTAVFAFIGLNLLFGIMDGHSQLSITVGGMLMGYFLATGNWRPTRFWATVKLWWLRQRRRQSGGKRGLHVVPDRRDDKDRTMH